MMDEGDAYLCAEALTRSQLYGIVARILSEPEGILNEKYLWELERVAGESPPYQEIADLTRTTRAGLRRLNLSARSASREYTESILKGEAPPYEASYVPPAQALSTLADVAGFMRAFGLQPQRERPDHLVSELEFLSFLCLKETIARGNGIADGAGICRDAQAKFVREHLGRWLPAYARRLREKFPESPFLLTVDLVRTIVRVDADFLEVVPHEIKEAPGRAQDIFPRCGFAR